MGGHPFYPPIQFQPGGLYPSVSPVQGLGAGFGLGQLGSPILKQSFLTPSGYPALLYQLSNGHHVLLEQRKGALTSLRTFINTGSIHEDPIHPSRLYGKTGLPSGIAHLDEHCHFLTTQNFPEKNSWVKAVQKMGAQLNATTSPEWIQHELTFHQDDLFPMIAMHGEAVMRPKYEDGTIHQEKQNVLNEAAERTQEPEAKMDSKLFELMFDRPAFQTLGKASDVSKTTARQLQQFYDTYYTPENMITVISGNFNPQQVLNAINQEFGKNTRPLHGDEAKGLVFSLQPGQVKSATIYDPKLTYSTAQLGFPGPHKSNFKERMAMEILMAHLVQGNSSLLNRRVKDQERCVNQIDGGFMPIKRSGIVTIGFHTHPGQEGKALSSVLNTVQSLSLQPMNESKLQELKNRLSFAYKRMLTDSEQCTQLMGEESLSNSLPYFLNYTQLLNSITPEDLRQVAQKYLNPQTYCVVYGIQGAQASETGIQDMPGNLVKFKGGVSTP